MPRAGLGGLLGDLLGIEVDKTYQRADWRVRPLPSEQCEYARGDTRFLIQVWRILRQKLSENSLYEEALAAFQRTNQSPPQGRRFNPEAFLQMPEARRLSSYHKARLRDLFRWRDDKARQLDEAVFRVLPDGLMIPLVLQEGDEEALRAHFRHPTIQREAGEIVAILKEAARQPYRAALEAAPTQPLRGRQFEHYERLRRWRNQLANELGIDTDRVFTNRALKALVLAQPRSWEELAAVEGMEDWRLAKFGQALWSEVQKF